MTPFAAILVLLGMAAVGIAVFGLIALALGDEW